MASSQIRESLNSSVTQLQDELHSKCEQLNRAELQTQKVQRESTSLKQVYYRYFTQIPCGPSHWQKLDLATIINIQLPQQVFRGLSI